MATPYTPPTFLSSEDWKTHLDQEGYVVIREVLTPEQKSESMELFKREWNRVSSGFSWENATTWNIQNSPMMFGKGMALFNGFGQSSFMWSLRTNPNIYGIFQKLHGTEELVVSMDGFSIFLSDKQKSKSWLHIDQNPKNDIYSIQGAYNFLPVGENDAGFIVVPRSHKEFIPETKNKKDWLVVDQDIFLPQAKKLIIPENCFVLWNSKLIHANQGMEKGTTGFNRLTTYITYLPKSSRPESIKIKRMAAYLDGKATSHWSNKCELKRYPFGFKTNYEKKGFANILPETTADGSIPVDRMRFI
jgi:hypothetical protein